MSGVFPYVSTHIYYDKLLCAPCLCFSLQICLVCTPLDDDDDDEAFEDIAYSNICSRRWTINLAQPATQSKHDDLDDFELLRGLVQIQKLLVVPSVAALLDKQLGEVCVDFAKSIDQRVAVAFLRQRPRMVGAKEDLVDFLRHFVRPDRRELLVDVLDHLGPQQRISTGQIQDEQSCKRK